MIKVETKDYTDENGDIRQKTFVYVNVGGSLLFIALLVGLVLGSIYMTNELLLAIGYI